MKYICDLSWYVQNVFLLQLVIGKATVFVFIIYSQGFHIQYTFLQLLALM